MDDAIIAAAAEGHRLWTFFFFFFKEISIFNADNIIWSLTTSSGWEETHCRVLLLTLKNLTAEVSNQFGENYMYFLFVPMREMNNKGLKICLIHPCIPIKQLKEAECPCGKVVFTHVMK